MEIDSAAVSDNRLGSCEVCGVKSIYTCPKCSIKTCSLKCSKIHKAELECDGIRDRTKYKPLKQMTPLDFMNDYYFLEEATRFTKTVKCNSSVKSSNTKLQQRSLKLRKEAIKRNIQFYFLNNGFIRRKRNQSFYKFQEDAIHWFVEFIFTNADLTIRKKINENTKIQDALKEVLESENKKQLEFYRAAGISKLRVMLKAEGLKGCQSRFFEMNIKKTLKANLSGKVIIEYPTLHVVLDHSAGGFDVIPSDDETIAEQAASFRRTLHEEVFSKKVGQNPPLILKPEEIPIISEVIGDAETTAKQQSPGKSFASAQKIKTEDSDDEVQPENYFFSNDS